MTGHLDSERFEELALEGKAGKSEDAHLSQCTACARELAWARAERALLLRRTPLPVDHLWPGVRDRIMHPTTRAQITPKPGQIARRFLGRRLDPRSTSRATTSDESRGTSIGSRTGSTSPHS